MNECCCCCCRRRTLLLSIASIFCHNERARKSNDRTRVPNERNNWACPTKQIASTEQVRCVTESSVRCMWSQRNQCLRSICARANATNLNTKLYYYVNEYTPMSARMATSVRNISFSKIENEIVALDSGFLFILISHFDSFAHFNIQLIFALPNSTQRCWPI